jgi:hypothetical protein
MKQNGQQSFSIYDAWKAGDLDRAIELGVVRDSVVFYCKIYEEYKIHRDAGLTYSEAVIITSESMFCSEATIKRAIAIVI